MEVLLVIRGGEHEERPSENSPESLERVSTTLGEPFAGLEMFLIVPAEYFLGAAPLWRKVSATLSRKNTYLACTYYLKYALTFNQFIQILIVMGSISKAKLASFSPTPLRTK